MRYRQCASHSEAVRVSMASLKLRFPDTYVDGKGLPPGRGAHLLAPGEGYTTMAFPVMEGRDGKFYVQADADLPSRSVEIDGIETAPARDGVDMVRDDFKDLDIESDGGDVPSTPIIDGRP